MHPPPVEVLRVFQSLSYDECLSLLGGVKGALDDSPAAPPLTPHCATSDQLLRKRWSHMTGGRVDHWLTAAPLEVALKLTGGHIRM